MKNDQVREQVSQAYSEALRRSKQGAAPCCAPSTGCGSSPSTVEPAGVAAKSAGYTSELDSYREAGQSSFGCGNPLAFAGVEEGQTVVRAMDPNSVLDLIDHPVVREVANEVGVAMEELVLAVEAVEGFDTEDSE